MTNTIAVVTDPEACDYTGACQEICPTEAINLTYEIIFHKPGKEEDTPLSKKDSPK
jgi:formate hydrogenlyase subunit 6/NADH:ubiquinone oxidoreductase subunit I